MKIFRVLMSLHYTTADGWKGTHHLPTFYVHAMYGRHAQDMAILTTNPAGTFKTSGSAVEIDVNLDPKLDSDNYHSWCDNL